MKDNYKGRKIVAVVETQEMYIDIKMVQCNLETKECLLLDNNNVSIEIDNIDNVIHTYPTQNLVSSKTNFRTDFEKGAICTTDILKLGEFKLHQLNCITNE